MTRWAAPGSEALRTARSFAMAVPFWTKQPSRYMKLSMIPQARLQPTAPMSNVRTSCRPAWLTLMEQVEGKNHDQPEPDLRDSFYWFERALRCFVCDMCSWIKFPVFADHYLHLSVSGPDSDLLLQSLAFRHKDYALRA